METDLLSIISSVISIILGIYAIIQAVHYNKESERFNADTRKILDLQLEEIQTIERKITRDLIRAENNIIWMAKDSGAIYKLSTYDKSNNTAILNAFRNLKVKAPVLERFAVFLEENEKEEFYFDFFCFAETKVEYEFIKVKQELEKYGLLLIVNYQARKNFSATF